LPFEARCTRFSLFYVFYAIHFCFFLSVLTECFPSLFSDKEFTAKKVELVERKTVEHLLKRPCFIDLGGCPHAASILLDYVPSYKSFQKGPTVKHFRQEEVTVVRPGKDQEDIIQAVLVTARRGVQVPQLVPPLSNPELVPSLESSEVGLPIIRFPSFFDPDPKPIEEMPIQKRSINISTVLGMSALETSETSPLASPLAPPPGFSQGEDVMGKKRKRGKEQNDDVSGQEGSSPSRLPKAKAPKKGKSKNDQALQKATGQVSQRHMHQDESKQPWSCTFLLENRPVDEGDSVLKSGKGVRGGQVAEAVGKALLLPEDMKVWQEKRSKHMLENLKRDSILVSFEALYSNVSLYMLNELFIHMYIFHFILFFISFLGRSRYI
jgi:hypothetical protein